MCKNPTWLKVDTYWKLKQNNVATFKWTEVLILKKVIVLTAKMKFMS